MVNGVAFTGYQLFLFPANDRGRCLVLDQRHCIALTVATIEAEADISLPDSATVVRSGSRVRIFSGSVTALIVLPERDGISLGGDYVRAAAQEPDSSIGPHLARFLPQLDKTIGTPLIVRGGSRRDERVEPCREPPSSGAG